MNSKNSKTSDPQRLLPNLKYQHRHGMKSLNYLMDHFLYQIFKINLKIS